MTPLVGFVACLVATVALLAAVVWTGVTARVRLHVPLVALTVAALGVTIYFAKQLGDAYDLASAGWITPVHLAIAKLATAAYLAPVVTGVMTLRSRRHRRTHLKAAMAALALTLVSTVTGLWMLLAATPRA